VRVPDRTRALELLARIKRMLVDRVDYIDPEDPRNWSDEELAERGRALDAALELIEKAKVPRPKGLRKKG
jgi:hypothetical protein